MAKIRKHDGFLGFRTTKKIETDLKSLCCEHNTEVSDILNYLCRIFLEDGHGIRTVFFKDRASVNRPMNE